MAKNEFSWEFPKTDTDYIYDIMKKFGDQLIDDSDKIFAPLITIANLPDDSITYAFHIIVPELSGFTLRIFEVNRKMRSRKFEVLFPSMVEGPLPFNGDTEEKLINIIKNIIKTKEVRNDLGIYYNKVIVKRRQKKDFIQELPLID